MRTGAAGGGGGGWLPGLGEEEKSLGLEPRQQIIYYEKMMAAIGSNMDGQKSFSCLG